MTQTNIKLKANIFGNKGEYIKGVLSLAIKYADNKTIKELLSEVDYCPDICYETLLNTIQSNNLDIINTILEKKVLSNQAKINLFVKAARYSSKEIIEILIKQDGVSINLQNEYGETALHNAIFNTEEIFHYLLNLDGANVNTKDNDGDTVLHFAMKDISSSHDNLAVLLRDRTLNINPKNDNGHTPVSLAIGDLHNYPAILNALIDRGADLNTPESSCIANWTLLM